MLEVCWTAEGRDCTASFHSEAEARRCVVLLRDREEIRGVLLLDADGAPLEP